jgi:pimeloyl-ACP methyl ester carboxylesterase
MTTRARHLLTVLTLLCAAPSLASAQGAPTSPAPLPILFVHGNGDDAVRWVPTMWLFQTNGYPADRLFALRFSYPAARTDDTRDEPFRSSTTDAAAELAANVARVLIQTHSRQVILVGSSRGGMTIRNYLKNGGGAPNVAAAILCGTPNHGVVANDTDPNGEFNGKGTYLTALNTPSSDGSETVAGVRMLTLRSDTLDKYAQPTGVASGHPENATGITYEGPALKGATNLVLPHKDHRELAFSREAFARMYEFITGHPPRTLQVADEPNPSIAGIVTGYEGLVPTNLPLANVHLRIYAVSTPDTHTPVYETTTTPGGHWGPFTPLPHTEYEFDLEGRNNASSAAARHVRYFVAGLPRSSSVWNLRFLPAPALKDTPTDGMFLVSRQQGYFSRERDPVLIDGKPSQDEPAGLPVRDSFVAHLPQPTRSSTVTLRDETIKLPTSQDLATDLPIAYLLW